MVAVNFGELHEWEMQDVFLTQPRGTGNRRIFRMLG